MKQFFYFLPILALVACGTGQDSDTAASLKNDSIPNDTLNKNVEEDSDHATFFIVIADTSSSYDYLRKKMFLLSKTSALNIDTMGRYYNETKNLIALPDNADDEIYAGDYYPRRFPSVDLSLEYLSFYQKEAGDKTIALVAGIYETEKSADSALVQLKTSEIKAFRIAADIFTGCMH